MVYWQKTLCKKVKSPLGSHEHGWLCTNYKIF
ncbi:hypothetical protein CPL00124_CDS0202 [Escherchia phage Stokescottia]